jgi:MFS family permease
VKVKDRVNAVLAGVGWWSALRSSGPRRVLGLNALVDAFGSGLALVCQPFFYLHVAHLSAARFAVLLAAGGLAELAGAVPAGALAGRIGVWRYAMATRVLRAVGYLLIASAPPFWGLLGCSVAVGALRAGGNGLNQSLTASVIGEADRGEAVAVVRALYNLGFLAAGGVAAVLLSSNSGGVLVAAMVVNALSFLAGAALLSRIRPRGGAVVPGRRMDFSVLRDVGYLVLCAAATAFASSQLVLTVALPLLVVRTGNVAPAVVAAVVIGNTVLVVLLQYRFARPARAVGGALRGLRRATGCFAVMAALLALAQGAPAGLATLAVALAGLFLTVGEMLESPAWWTLSYELAPAGRTDEYLAAFDLNFAALNIVGPPVLVLVVYRGWPGWTGYVLGMMAATAVAHAVVRSAAAPVRTPVGRHRLTTAGGRSAS